MITPSFLPLLLAGPAFATLSLRQSSCPVNASAMSLPPNQSQLVAPNSSATFTAVGAGVQNYSCSTTGTYVSVLVDWTVTLRAADENYRAVL